MKATFRLKNNSFNFINACGKDDLRPSMQGINFNSSFKRLEITNGFIAILYTIDILSIDSDFSAIIDKRLFDEKFIKNKLGLKNLFLDELIFQIDLTNKISKVLNNGIVLLEYALIDEKYLNIDSVIPKNKQDINQIGISPKLLSQLEKCLPKDTVTLKFEFFGKNKAITFSTINTENEIENNSVNGILMPMIIKD